MYEASAFVADGCRPAVAEQWQFGQFGAAIAEREREGVTAKRLYQVLCPENRQQRGKRK